MKLSEYMKSNSLSDADMASRIGCSEGAVKKWRYEERTPRPEQMRLIAEFTEYAVTANDFMAISGPPTDGVSP